MRFTLGETEVTVRFARRPGPSSIVPRIQLQVPAVSCFPRDLDKWNRGVLTLHRRNVQAYLPGLRAPAGLLLLAVLGHSALAGGGGGPNGGRNRARDPDPRDESNGAFCKTSRHGCLRGRRALLRSGRRLLGRWTNISLQRTPHLSWAHQRRRSQRRSWQVALVCQPCSHCGFSCVESRDSMRSQEPNQPGS